MSRVITNQKANKTKNMGITRHPHRTYFLVFEILVTGSVNFNLKIRRLIMSLFQALLLLKGYLGLLDNNQCGKGEKIYEKVSSNLTIHRFSHKSLETQPENGTSLICYCIRQYN